LSEVADLLQTSRTTVANWRARRGNFPAPVADLKSGPIWRQADVIEWADAEGLPIAATALKAMAGTDEGPGARTVAVMNAKGGVGKSTLAANLGWYLAHQENQRVLMVDLDPQFNLSQYVLGTAKYEDHVRAGQGTVLDIFEQVGPVSASKGKTAVVPDDVISRVKAWSDGSRIDLLPSQLELSWTLKNPSGKEHLLAHFLDQVRGSYDTIVIDCAPTESVLTTAAYLATDKVLVPVKPEFLATVGLPILVRSLSDFQHLYRQPVDVMGIVFNIAMDNAEHRRSRAFVRKAAGKNGWDVFANEVLYSDSYPKGSRLGKPIFLTDYARAYKISNFLAVAEEFMARLNA
jgi:chromosome partitioning protein